MNKDFIEFSNEWKDEVELEQFHTDDMHSGQKKYMLKTKNLSSRMEAEKGKVGFWIELLEIQDIAKNSIFQGKEKMISEKKLSILEKALDTEELKGNVFLRLLRLKLISESEKGEDTYKMMGKEWVSLLGFVEDPTMVIQAVHLEYKHSHFNTFSASLLRKNIRSLLQETGSLREGSSMSTSIRKYEMQMLMCLVHFLMVETHMGYTEKVAGVLSAMVEINVTAPQQVEDFGKVWNDSTACRLGDQDSHTKSSMEEFDSDLLAMLGMEGEGFKEQFYSKGCRNLLELSKRERLYSQLMWRAARSSSEKVRRDDQEKNRSRFVCCCDA